MFLAYIRKGPNQRYPTAEFFLILVMVSLEKSFSDILSSGFIQLTRGNHVVQHHIYINKATLSQHFKVTCAYRVPVYELTPTCGS